MALDPVCGMNVSEKTGLCIDHNGRKTYFCSQHCLQKYCQNNHIDLEGLDETCHVLARVPPWYKNKTVIVAMILTVLCLTASWVPLLVPFRNLIFHYLSKTWWAILLGLFIGGVIDRYIPQEYISSALSKNESRTIMRSVFLGFFMSTCSHGILALSIQLHKKGASNPAVVAFLLASPWANMTFTLMLFGFFGLKAIYIVLCAIVIAVNTGLIFQVFEKRGWIEANPNTVAITGRFSIWQDIQRRFVQAAWTPAKVRADAVGIYNGAFVLADMILWWLLIGIALASFLGAYVPSHIFHQWVGPSISGLLITLALATVIEVCSEGSTPIAFEIFKQTGALGNAFVFLMAGVATDYTEIGLLWANVGRRVAVWLPLVTLPQILLLGILANHLFR